MRLFTLRLSRYDEEHMVAEGHAHDHVLVWEGKLELVGVGTKLLFLNNFQLELALIFSLWISECFYDSLSSIWNFE